MRRSFASLLAVGSILVIGATAQAQTPNIIWGGLTDQVVKPANISWGGGNNQLVKPANISWGGGNNQLVKPANIIWGGRTAPVTGNVMMSLCGILWGG
jgi:hypothetical protein